VIVIVSITFLLFSYGSGCFCCSLHYYETEMNETLELESKYGIHKTLLI
jgi:hypothetical protein